MAATAEHLIPGVVRKEWSARDALNTKLREQFRQECIDAIAELADAMRFPDIATADLERAQKSVLKALSIAAALDPQE